MAYTGYKMPAFKAQQEPQAEEAGKLRAPRESRGSAASWSSFASGQTVSNLFLLPVNKPLIEVQKNLTIGGAGRRDGGTRMYTPRTG